MKKYIRAAVSEYVTLRNWIENNQGVIDPNTQIWIEDCQPYGVESDETPGLMFTGTFTELSTGVGRDNLFNWDGDLALDEYLAGLEEYEVAEVLYNPKNSYVYKLYVYNNISSLMDYNLYPDT